MSNVMRRIVSVIGILVGAFIIFIGLTMVSGGYSWTSTETIGEPIQFGADFYTEIYSVTKDVGNAVNNVVEATNSLGSVMSDVAYGIGWLIVSLGAIDVCAFLYALCAPKQKTMARVFGVEKNTAKDVPAKAEKAEESSETKETETV